MKRYVGVIFLFICICMISGCSLFPDGTMNQVEDNGVEGNQTALKEKDGHIEGQLLNNMRVDADVVTYGDTEWKQLKATGKKYGQEQADQDALVFQNKENIVESKSEDVGGYIRYEYSYDDGAYFYGDTYTMSYFRNKDKYVNSKRMYMYNRIFSSDSEITADLNQLFSVEELEGVSKQDAINEVRQICKKLNINLSDIEPSVYVMDTEHMNQLIEQYTSLQYVMDLTTGNKERNVWTEEDEEYYMTFYMEMNGVPILAKGFSTETLYAAQCEVTVVYGRDGIIKLNANRLYDFESAQDLEGTICSASEALDSVAATYQYNTDTDFDISQIQLMYVVIGKEGQLKADKTEYTVRPYWACTMVYHKSKIPGSEEKDYHKKITTLVDAVTKTVYKGAS